MSNVIALSCPLLTVEEIAEYLRVKPATVYSWTHKKKIPFKKINGDQVRFDRSEIDAWVTACTVKPVTTQSKFQAARERLRSLKTEHTATPSERKGRSWR